MKMNLKKIGLASLLTALVLNLLIGYGLHSDNAQSEPGDNGYNAICKLMFVINKIRRYYVDESKVAYNSLFRGAIRGVVKSLDPFCSYMDEKDFNEMTEETQGREYGGIGIVVTYKNNALKVISPTDNSPAARAGILPGDLIVKIDGTETSTLNFDECVKRLKGEVAAPVTLTIYRESKDETLDLTLKRELIEVLSVKGGKIVEDGIAYLRISGFNAPTAEELDKALKKLDESGMQALVIDLRGNPGGLLISAIEVSSRFIESGELVVYTEGRAKNSRLDYYSIKCRKYTELPIALLVDGNTASASEILAGCLCDHKRAFLVGEKTFGKGSVQSIFELPDKSGAIRITTAKYYTPGNRVIHENGIEPTVIIPLSREEIIALYNQRNSYPGIIEPDTDNPIRDVQLERAVEILRGVCLLEKNLQK